MNNVKPFCIFLVGFLILFSSCAKEETIIHSKDAQEAIFSARSNAAVPFKGIYKTFPEVLGPPIDGVITLHITAEGNATHLGRSSWVAEQWTDTKTFPFTIGGIMTFTAANEDQIFSWYDGAGIPNSDGSVSFSGSVYIDSGSGRFTGITGTLPYFGTAVADDVGELVFHDGTLYYD